MPKVTLLISQPKAFLAKVQVLARDSETVGLPPRDHNPDKVTPAQLFAVLERGRISQGPYADQHGNVVAELCARASGDEVFLSVTIEGNAFLRILHAEKHG